MFFDVTCVSSGMLGYLLDNILEDGVLEESFTSVLSRITSSLSGKRVPHAFSTRIAVGDEEEGCGEQ